MGSTLGVQLQGAVLQRPHPLAAPSKGRHLYKRYIEWTLRQSPPFQPLRSGAIFATVMALGVLLAGCSGSSSGAQAPPPIRYSPGRVPHEFVGEWDVHGVVLTIPATGPATESAFDGGDNAVIVTHLSATVSSDHRRIRLTVVDQAHHVAEADEPSRNPDPKSDFVIGDSYVLKVVDRGLLDTINIHTRYRVISNGYWCGDGMPAKYRDYCGQ